MDDSLLVNALIHGDNLAGLRALQAGGLAGRVALAYLDPPFVSRAHYAQTVVLPDGRAVQRPVYSDHWASLDEWLDQLWSRLRLVHALLADTGSLYVHLDWRAAPYARVLLDELFGPDCFRNEIVWKRAATLGRKAVSGQYGRVTDSLLFYSKSDQYTFNRGTVEREVSRREVRWDAERGRWFRTAPRGDYTDTSLAALAAQGRVHHTRNGKQRVKYFVDETADGRLVEQAPLDNLWLDIPDMMHLPAAERTGYPTQKPLALLRRIVAVSSNPDDVVLDPFAGAGTTLVAATGLGRRWIGIEASRAGVAVSRARLLEGGATGFTLFAVAAEEEEREEKGKDGEGKGGTLVGVVGEPQFQLSLHLRPVSNLQSLISHLSLLTEPAMVEYWAVDWAYNGVFQSAWQGWRGYGRQGRTIPTEASGVMPLDSHAVAVRWETVDGRSGLQIFSL